MQSLSSHSAATDVYVQRGFKPQECPACGQQCFRPIVLQRHLERCCPDLLRSESEGDAGIDGIKDLNALDGEEVEHWMKAAKAREDEKQERAVRKLNFSYFSFIGNPPLIFLMCCEPGAIYIYIFNSVALLFISPLNEAKANFYKSNLLPFFFKFEFIEFFCSLL